MHSRIVQQQNEQNERFSLHSVCGRTGRFGQKRESFKYVQRRGTVHTRGHAVGYADGHTVGHTDGQTVGHTVGREIAVCSGIHAGAPHPFAANSTAKSNDQTRTARRFGI